MSNETTAQNPEQIIDSDRPIAELLPRYLETHPNYSYEIEDSITIDGHEVAWLTYDYAAWNLVDGNKEDFKHFTGHALECACHFTEGVGWGIQEETGQVFGYRAGDGCEKKKATVGLRHKNLHDEYVARGMIVEGEAFEPKAIAAVMLDLIDKGKHEKFLEGSTGARFWGGYYYLQTAQAVVGASWTEIWKAVDGLEALHKIRLEGMVVQEYREPYQPPTYEADTDLVPVFNTEKADKVWALVPRPEETSLELSKTEITDQNRTSLLGHCIVGLAHTAELAEARLKEAVTNPRLSHERLYQLSFVEAGYHAGALAVLAYTARTSDQPEEWVVETFLGDAVTPEVHTLAMNYPTIFGIDVADQANLNVMIDTWYPAA